MKNLDPADYQYGGSYYLGSNEDLSDYTDWTEVEEAQKGGPYTPERKSAGDDLGRCDHCGAAHQFGSIYIHKATGQWVGIGHTCSSETFRLPDRAAIKRKNAEKKVAASRELRKKLPTALRYLGGALRQEPTLKAFLRSDNNFAKSLRQSVFQYGYWTEGQKNAVLKAAQKHAAAMAAPEIEKADELKPTAEALEGRVTMTGTVMFAWYKEDPVYGGSSKMKFHDDRGFEVIGTFPSGLGNYHEAKGRRIIFVATLQKANDFGLAWAKRPTKAHFETQLTQESA